MADETAFDVGDRVRLRPEKADGYCLPLRKWAKDGRLATVEGVNWEYSWRTARVRFDARKPKRPTDYVMDIRIEDLERANG